MKYQKTRMSGYLEALAGCILRLALELISSNYSLLCPASVNLQHCVFAVTVPSIFFNMIQIFIDLNALGFTVYIKIPYQQAFMYTHLYRCINTWAVFSNTMTSRGNTQ